MTQPKGFFKDNGSTRPITQSKGIQEGDFREGDKNILSTPTRKFSTATPSSELAHARTQMNYLKSLNRRFAESRASAKSRESAKKTEKEKRREEVDKNMQLANQFFDYAKAVQKGQNPEPVNVTVDVNNKETLPKSLSEEEKIKTAQQNVAEQKKEEKTIQNITAKSPQASSAAMAPPTTGSKHPPEPKQKPIQKTNLSLSELALLEYPVKG